MKILLSNNDIDVLNQAKKIINSLYAGQLGIDNEVLNNIEIMQAHTILCKITDYHHNTISNILNNQEG